MSQANTRPLLLIASQVAILVLASTTQAAAAPPPSACAAARTGVPITDGRQTQAARPETAAALAQLKAARNGAAAPNAEAQAMLGVLANMSASRGDPDSRAAAEALRAAAGRPGATGSEAMAAALAKLGC